MSDPARVLIVAASLGTSARHAPLGAARIVSALKAHPVFAGRIDPKLLAVSASCDPDRLVRDILDRRPRAVGFSVYVWNRDLLLSAARSLRRALPGLILFAGGPEATADPDGIRSEGALNFVVEGEGEESAPPALERALAGADPGSIPGVRAAWPLVGSHARPPDDPAPQRAVDSRARAPDIRPRADLSHVPSPYLDGTLDVSEYGGALWELARGCPFACHFCYESKGCRGVRRFPDERIRAELRAFVQGGAREVFVLDPTFNANPEKAREILTLLRREAPGIHFTFEIRSEFLDAAQARLFGSIPCSVQVGLQSARPEVLAGVGRPGFDRRDFRRRMALLSAAGVVFGLDLIYGLPGDDLAGFRESLDYALSLAPNHLDVFRLSVLPGTALADRAEKLGLVHETRPPYGVLSSPSFSAGDLARAENLARATEVFYTRGRAVGWFLSVLRPLRGKPSAFLEGIVEESRERLGARRTSNATGEPIHKDIEVFQLRILESAYRAAGAENLFPVARDLVTLHGAWTRALAEGETTRLRLSRNPEDLFGPASRDPARLARAVPEKPGVWVVGPGRGGPRIESPG